MEFKKLYFLSFVVISFLQNYTFAQGVCDITTNIEKGGFTFDTPNTGCHPLNVKIKDNSGGTDVKYIFDYKGEAASKLSTLSPTTNLTNTFTNFTNQPVTYVILQYGKKGGKDMYYCNVVTVRPDNEPVFTTSACNGSLLNLTIPKDPANDFDYYKIDWGSPHGTQTVNTIPFNTSKSYPFQLSQTIKVEGFYNSGNTNCAAPNSRTIPMNSGGNYPTITKLELSSDNKEVTLTFTGSAENNFNIYQRSGSTPNYTFGQNATQNVAPGVYKIPVIDTTKSCFIIYRQIGCPEMSGEVCTVKLDPINPVGKTNPLIWTSHPVNKISLIGGIGTGITNTTVTIKKEETISGTKASIPVINSQTTFQDNVDCTKDFCYQIEVKTTNNSVANVITNSISLSPKRCVSRKDFQPPAITDALISVNDLNQAVSTYTDNSGWTLQKTKFRLLRNESGKYKSVDSAATLVKLIDKIDAAQQSYCYKLDYTDECGSTSEPSPEFCTVNLTESGSSQLKWTTQSPFANSPTDKYEVQYYDEITGAINTEVTNNASQNTHNPDLDNFEEEAKYRIRIISTNGKESFSNVYTIPIQVKVFIPDAFSPNGDAKNDNLEIFGTFRRIQEFSLKIYNRWGIPVFTTDDPKITWDGTYLGQPAPPDIYSYSLLSKLTDGQELRKMGSIRLFR